MSNMTFARTIVEIDLGVTASSVMTDCEKYGMTYGCNAECPVLINRECELQDTDNKDIFNESQLNK